MDERILKQVELRLGEEDNVEVNERYGEIIRDFIKQFESIDFQINEDLHPAFVNHVVVLFKRIQQDEQLSSEIPQDAGRVSSDSLEKAHQLIASLENKLDVQVTEFEKFLLSLYIEMSGMSRKEGD